MRPASRQQVENGAFHVHVDAEVDAVDPAECGSFSRPVAVAGRGRGRGIAMGRRSCAGEYVRLWCGRTEKPQASQFPDNGSRRFFGVEHRHSGDYSDNWPPRMVSAKWTPPAVRESSTLAMGRGHAALPPITVWALPSNDLQIRPTLTLAAEASIAARKHSAAGADHEHIHIQTFYSPP